jgi:aryl-alcohol dehydrogenase-like predicted oxidoreductase
MEYRYIGNSGLRVSSLGLGSMTFGSDASKKEAFKILDKAYESGVNFIDTAEMYPSPVSKDTAGISEIWVGEWLKTKPRDSIILATKVTGAANGWFVPPIRAGLTALDSFHIKSAIEGSLKRLKTDYIDLYQTHWPDTLIPIDETLKVLDDLVCEGKVRYVGTSNDSCYGLTKANEISKNLKISRFQSIQNNFSLNNPRFLDELSTVCEKEKISLLAYSPMAGGVLSGKYNDGQKPNEARYTRHFHSKCQREREMANRFVNKKTLKSTEKYAELADSIGVSTASLSLAWVMKFKFVASTLTSARNIDQLEDSLKSLSINLDDSILTKIEQIQKEIMYPMG